MKSQHRHRPKQTRDYPFTGAVARPENRAAHGNICEVSTCSCGATRATNVNGFHREYGPWLPAAPVQ